MGYFFILYVAATDSWRKMFAIAPILLFVGIKSYAIYFYHLYVLRLCCVPCAAAVLCAVCCVPCVLPGVELRVAGPTKTRPDLHAPPPPRSMEFLSDQPPQHLLPYFSVEGPYIVSLALCLVKTMDGLHSLAGKASEAGESKKTR